VIFGTRCKRKAKKIYKRKRASRLEGRGGLEGCQIIVCLGGCMGGIYILSMQCLSILWDSHSPVWRTQTNMFMILLPRTPAIPFLFFFFFFAFKTDGKIFLLLYPFFYLLFFINIFNQQQFSLTATILGCESRSMELFLGMHVQSDDHQKRVQQLVDSRA